MFIASICKLLHILFKNSLQYTSISFQTFPNGLCWITKISPFPFKNEENIDPEEAHHVSCLAIQFWCTYLWGTCHTNTTHENCRRTFSRCYCGCVCVGRKMQEGKWTCRILGMWLCLYALSCSVNVCIFSGNVIKSRFIFRLICSLQGKLWCLYSSFWRI